VPIITTVTSTPIGSQLTAFARSAAGSIAETAERLQAALPSRGPQAVAAPAAAAAAPAPAPIAPAPAALEVVQLALSGVARTRIAPPADAIGLTLNNRELRGTFSGRLYNVTELGNGTVKRWLVQGKDDVLTDPSADNRERLGMLQFLFAQDDKVYFMAEGVDAPNWALQNIVEKLWKQSRGKIVPWSQVNGLCELPLSDQIDFLRSKFDLEGVQATPDESPNLTTNDIDAIVVVLVTFSEFTDVAGRQALIMEAGLRDLASDVDLQGAARTVAYNLLFQLRRKPKLATGSTALGALLAVLIKRPTVPTDQVTLLTEIRTRFGL
jgi:hypothetical protein